jgi:hypothetical protein
MLSQTWSCQFSRKNPDHSPYDAIAMRNRDKPARVELVPRVGGPIINARRGLIIITRLICFNL